MAELGKEQIAELKQKHGDLTSITAPNGDVLVFHKPSRATWGFFVDSVSKDRNSKHTSMVQLALACVAHPSVDAASAVLESYPGLATTASGVIAKMAGSGDESEFDVKKL